LNAPQILLQPSSRRVILAGRGGAQLDPENIMVDLCKEPMITVAPNASLLRRRRSCHERSQKERIRGLLPCFLNAVFSHPSHPSLASINLGPGDESRPQRGFQPPGQSGFTPGLAGCTCPEDTLAFLQACAPKTWLVDLRPAIAGP
jgi:hypothetical protein